MQNYSYQVSGDLGQALEQMKEAERLALGRAGIYHRDVGLLYAMLKNWPHAVDEVNHLWDQKGGDDELAMELAAVIVAMRSPSTTLVQESVQEGALTLDMGTRLSDPTLRSLLDAGSRAFEQGQWAEARKSFEQALALDPDNAYLVLMLAKSYTRVGLDEQGVAVLESALKRQPREPLLFHALGWLYYGLERYPEALLTWEQLKEIDEVAYRTVETLVRELHAHVYRKYDHAIVM